MGTFYRYLDYTRSKKKKKKKKSSRKSRLTIFNFPTNIARITTKLRAQNRIERDLSSSKTI